MPRFVKPILIATGATLLASAAPALAGTDATLGHGKFPDVVTTDDGTAHVAWLVDEPAGDDAVQYCAVPRGATACGATATLRPGGELFGLEVVAGDGGSIAIVAQNSERNRALGFTPPALPTDAGWRDAGEDVPIADGGVAHVAGSVFVAASQTEAHAFDLNAPAGGGNVVLPVSFNVPTRGAIGADAGRPVAAVSDGDFTEVFRYTGPVPASADAINTASNWSGPAGVAPALDEPSLAGGPSGLMLFGATSPGGFPSRPQIRSLAGGAIGGGVDVQKAKDAVYHQVLAQHEGNGRLYATWRVNGADGGHIKLVKSLDGGGRWSRLGDLRHAEEGGSGNGMHNFNLSAAADQQGLMVYDTEGPLQGTNRPIHGLTLDLVPGDVPTASTTKRGVTLIGPSACIPVNGFFKAKAKGKHLIETKLSLDGKQVVKGRKATMNVKALAPGSKHTLKARAIVGTGGTTVIRTVKRAVDVCG